MKAKLLTVLSLVIVLTLLVAPVLAIAPADAPAVKTTTPAQPAAKVEAAPAAAAPVTAAAKPAQVSGPFIGEAIVPGSYDGDLRDLPQLPAAPGAPGPDWRDEIPNRDTVRSKGSAVGESEFDSVVQRDVGSGDMPAPLLTFDGMNNQDNFAIFGGRVNPPDTNGAVGPNHYISSVNLVYGVFDKSGTKLFGPAKISTIFAAAPTGTPCDSTDPGDPIVLYDSGADRWIMSQFGFTSTANLVQKYECIAVSKGPNPLTSGWWTYAIPAPGDQFNDYPKLSVWPDAYYYTARMFPGSAPFFLSVYALERPAMLAGRPARTVRFDLPGIYDSPLATNWRGEAPPAGTPALIALADDVTNSIVTWQFKVDWDNPANSTLSAEYPVAVAPFEEACPGTRDCIPFTGSTSTTLLDDLSPRLMFNLEYRRVGGTESVWANHTITESGRTVVRWYEFRYQRAGNIITPTVHQQGTYAPADNVWRWMASLAADKDNNMAIGWSASAPNIDPQIRYAGRLVTDTLGVLAQGEVTMTVGTGHPTNTNSRWGDYSAMNVDPVDDCTFWYTQQYYTTTTGIPGDTRPWATRIGSFKYPSCTPLAATGTITGIVYDATTLAPIARIPVDAYDATNNRIYAGATDAAGVYTMTVLPGTYDVSGGPFASIGYPVKGTVSGVVVTSNTTTGGNNIPLNGAPFMVLGARTYADSVVGNGNGYPEPGEKQIGVSAVLTNTGVTTATSVVATLTSLTAGFTVITPTASYPDITAGSAASNSSPFGISIDGGLACGTVGSFQQVVVTAQGTFTLPYTLKLGIPPVYTCTFPTPNLSVASTAYTETSGDGYLQPGEVVTLNVTLSNTGLTNIGPASGISAALTELTPGFTLTVNSSAYPNIAANGSGVNSTPFRFTIDPNLICGAALDFGMAMTTTEGAFADSFRLVTGQPAVVPTTVLYDNVEAGAGVWVTSTNIPGVGFTMTSEDSHSPTHSWTDSPGALYPNGLDTSLTSPVFDFTSFDSVQVEFWHTYSTEQGFDYGLVEYSINGGTTWITAAAYDDVQAAWTQATVNLSGAAHQSNVHIRFRFVADTGVNDDGWYIDDIRIGGQQYGCATGQIEAVRVDATPTDPFVNTLAVITATVSDLVGTPAASVPVTFTTGAYYAHLSGANETPPVSTSATGHFDLNYDPATNQLTYSGSVSGLSGAITGAHIHRGVAGVPGPVAVSLSYSGTTFSGLAVLSPSDEALLLSGGLYINVHTALNPGGEIRDQILDHNLTSILRGANEVPPVVSSGTGALIFMFDPTNNRLMYHGSVSGLNSNVTAAHIHTGTTGTNGGVLHNLSYITTTNGATFSGVVTVTQAQVNALLSAGLYANVHTTSSPGGEVRGQINVGWLGVTDSQGRAVTHFTTDTPGPVTFYAFAGSVFGDASVVFQDLLKIWLPIVLR